MKILSNQSKENKSRPVLETVFEAAAFFLRSAEFGTLVEFLVVAVIETPTGHIARIMVEAERAPRITWWVAFDQPTSCTCHNRLDPGEICLDPGVDAGSLYSTDIGHSVVNFLCSPVTGKEIINTGQVEQAKLIFRFGVCVTVCLCRQTLGTEAK